MNCSEAESHLSALYDGEPVAHEVAEHAAQCENCRAVLNDYSRMGAELRLASALDAAPLPPLKIPKRRAWLDVLWARIAIPRFALVTLLAGLVLLPIGVSMLRAQSRPLWFEFGYTLRPDSELHHYFIAEAGYDAVESTLGYVNGRPVSAAIRISVDRVSDDDVRLRVRAIKPPLTAQGSGFAISSVSKNSILLEGVPAIHYKQGDALPVPIEGGGTIYLKGEVLDHQPQIAFGYPLEAPPEKLIVRAPVLTDSHELLASEAGATALVGNSDQAIRFQAGSNGLFLFSLHEFPGAVEGKAEWGEIKFKMDGEDYRLVAAAPITGGDQPVPVWVRRDVSNTDEVSLGAGRITQ